jgi:ComF family protein
MLCGACLRRPPAWNEALAALVYEYPVDQLVQQFKFRRALACGQLLADEMARFVNQSGTALPDVLIPVPLHITRQFWRGFNQAEFLARRLGSRYKIPVLVNQLQRTRRTSAQSGLDRRARKKNIRGAFSCRQLAYARVALVDDVLTTGTTLAECARAVRAAGASNIAVWVAARVPKN